MTLKSLAVCAALSSSWALGGVFFKHLFLRLVFTIALTVVIYDRFIKYRGKRRALSGASATMAQGGMPPSTGIPDSIINSLVYVTALPEQAHMVDVFQKRLTKFERFSSIPVPGEGGEYVWQPVMVHAEDHIIYHEVKDDQELYEKAMAITETKLRNPLLPRWEVHVIRNLALASGANNKRAEFVAGTEAARYDAAPPTGKSKPSHHMILFRLCHSIGDGIGLVVAFQDLLQDLNGNYLSELDPESQITSLPTSPAPRTDLASPGGDNSATASKRVPSVGDKNPLKGKRLSFGLVKDILACAGNFLTMATGKFDTGLAFNGCAAKKCQMYSGRRRMVKVRPFSLAMVKEIKNKANVTVNDVCFAAAAAAIRHYSIAVASLRPDATKVSIIGDTKPFERRSKADNVPELLEDDDGIRLNAEDRLSRAMLPMAFPRSLTDPAKALRNHFTFVSVELATFESSAQARLMKTHQITSKLKRSPQALVSMALSDFVSSLAPLSFVQQTVADTFSRHSMVFSNVPGPDQPILFAGAPVSEVQMVYPNLVTQVGLLSYNGSIFMNFTLDDQAIPSPELLGLFFHDELKRYCWLYGVQYRDAPFFDA